MKEDEIGILKNKILEFNIEGNAEFAEEKKKLLEFLGLNWESVYCCEMKTF